MESRQHRRVSMHLPVRLRWTAPFGQKIELGETIDVSRGGLLVSTKEPHTPGVTVWVTFPYDASLFDGQPEILARVAPCCEIGSTRPLPGHVRCPSNIRSRFSFRPAAALFIQWKCQSSRTRAARQYAKGARNPRPGASGTDSLV